MTTPLNKEQLAQFSAGNLAYHGEYVEGLGEPVGMPERDSAFARWTRALAARLSAYRERRAVLNELTQLSDRDLADIGLSRADLHRVFEPEFAQARRVGGMA